VNDTDGAAPTSGTGRTPAPMNSMPGNQSQAESKLLAAFHQLSPNPLILVDATGNVTFASDAVQRALEPLGPNASAGAFFPGDMDSILAHLRRREPAAFLREVKVGNRVFEEYIWVRPDHDAAFINAKDITELKQTKEEVRELAALLQAFVDSPPDTQVFALDRDCRYTAFNMTHRQEMKKMYGAAIVAGMRMPDIIDKPEVKAKTQRSIDRALAGMSFTDVEVLPDLGTWYEFNWSPIRALDGKVEGVTAFIQDIARRKRVETALAESELKYRRVFESSNDAIMLLDSERFFDCNSAALKVFGYTTRDEFLGKHPAEVSPSRQADGRESLTAADEKIAAAFKAGRNHFEWLHQRADGTVFPADVLLTPMDFRGHKVLQATVRDISDRKQAETELRDSELKFRAIFDSASDGMLVFDPDSQRFALANSSCLQMLGYSADEFANLRLTDLHPEEDLPFIYEQVGSFMKGETGRRGDIRFRRRDGNLFPADTNPAGIVLSGRKCILVVFRDVTERKSAEERDRQHLEDTTLLRDTAIGFIALDPHADICRFIAERLARLAGEAYIVVNSYDATRDEFRVEAIEGIGDSAEAVLKLLGRPPVGITFRLAPEELRHYSGSTLMKIEGGLATLSFGKLPGVVRAAIESVFGLGDIYAMSFYWQKRILGTVNIIMHKGVHMRDPAVVEAFVNQAAIAIQHRRDADELERHRDNLAELVRERTAELEAANRELEAFSYSVSHDLRAPLRAIDGFAQAIIDDCGPQLDAKARGHLDRVSAAAGRMAELIDDLLNLARITRLPLERKPVDLSEMARDIADKLSRTAPDRRVKFAIPDGLTAPADPVLVSMVLRNLLTNAWKFTSRHPTARIEFGETRLDGKRTWFVRDDGAGFDIAYVEKLFQPFQRLHTEHEFPGTGIGLAIVQRIVRRHGGRVWIEGEVEKGATCRFTLEPEPREG